MVMSTSAEYNTRSKQHRPSTRSRPPLPKMPKRKSTGDGTDGKGTPKRSRTDQGQQPAAEAETQTQTPSKQRSIADTPSKQRSILKPAHPHITVTAAAAAAANVNGEATPKSLRKVLFSTTATPAKGQALVDGDDDDDNTIQDSPLTAARNADRSARRKTSRKLFTEHDDADEDDDVGEEVLREILVSEGGDEEDDDEEDEEDDDDGDSDNDDNNQHEEQDTDMIALASIPGTPSKTPTTSQLRARLKTKRRARSPTPIEDLPPHELYFYQNRAGSTKTSTNTLPSGALLNHDDYHDHISAYKDPHDEDRAVLADMHRASFEQWQLELDQGFNVCLYGYGSKRQLLVDFADFLYHASPPTNEKKALPPKIVIVNGYNPSLTLRDILAAIANLLLSSSKAQSLPLQPAPLLAALLNVLAAAPPTQPLHILIHSLDAPALRKHQAALSKLASHPSVHLIATADTPTFPLLWDISLRTAFRFLFHDTTTFDPYTAELDPVDDVNTLLGRTGRRVGGKDGVAFVLRSLPENARALYRILVSEQLALADADPDGLATEADGDLDHDQEERIDFEGDGPNMDHDADLDMDLHLHDQDDQDMSATPSKRRPRRGRPPKKPQQPKRKAPAPKTKYHGLQGVEYRTLYHRAVEEFVCSSEMSFRTLLKEFHDHDMLESRRDGLGVERLGVPFSREDMEEILGEIV